MNTPNYLISFVSIIFEVYVWLIVARVLISFARFRTYHPVVRFIYEVTEPLFGFFRRLLPRTGSFDFSPLLAFLCIEVVKQLVVMLLTSMFAVGR